MASIEAAGGEFGQVHHLVSGANQEKAWSTGDVEAGMVAVEKSGCLINDIPTWRGIGCGTCCSDITGRERRQRRTVHLDPLLS